MSEVVSNIGKSPGQMDTASGRRLGHVPTLTSQWWMLAEAGVKHDHDHPGVYELGDASGVVVRGQLKCHQKTPARKPRRIDDELHQAQLGALGHVVSLFSEPPSTSGTSQRRGKCRRLMPCLLLLAFRWSLGLPRVPAPVIMHGI